MAEPNIVIREDGFELVEDEQAIYRVRWADVREIYAVRVDLFAEDSLRLGFIVAGEFDAVEVDDHWPRFQELAVELLHRFDGDQRLWMRFFDGQLDAEHTVLWTATRAKTEATVGRGR